MPLADAPSGHRAKGYATSGAMLCSRKTTTLATINAVVAGGLTCRWGRRACDQWRMRGMLLRGPLILPNLKTRPTDGGLIALCSTWSATHAYSGARSLLRSRARAVVSVGHHASDRLTPVHELESLVD